jgi:hypothetical protein
MPLLSRLHFVVTRLHAITDLNEIAALFLPVVRWNMDGVLDFDWRMPTHFTECPGDQ